ncbi:MAG: hypothetical protein J1E98_13665 [Lachnospiraceae bacterium]|nr:hypothetical protein [Lachnospiraceae bacterium]
MENIFSELLSKCNEADMILIGIGEEFQYDWNILLQNPRYMEIEKEIDEERWIVPFLQKMMLENYPDDILDKAYRNLKKIVDGKNYFIITTVMDDYVYRYDFDEKRIVTPCGGFRRMQCDANCRGCLSEPDYAAFEKVKSYFNREISLNELQEPVCEICGQKKRFNQIGVSKYAEEGYLPQWETYTKWLQGTVNKKTSVIELGVGMQFPTIIRWPFERIVYYNKKAFLYRIHPLLYQLEEKIADRGIGIREKPVKFLANGFVK